MDVSTDDLAAIRAAILAHYAHHRRDLSFREERTPYRALVAEVMLQQTRMETALPYFERFVARFPDPASLAAADEQEVLRLWQGLGYYRRARHLHAAAIQVMRAHGGVIPDDPTELERLPGVGPYIAAAVGSICFGHRVASVDANVRRVLSRVFGIMQPLGEPETERKVRDLAEALLPQEGAGQWNEALMEFGAVVCRPVDPVCDNCPLAPHCRARAQGLERRIPFRRPKASKPVETMVSFVVEDFEEHLFLVQRPNTGLLAGMWEVPTFTDVDGDPARVAEKRYGIRLAWQKPVGQFTAVFSHRVWSVHVMRGQGTAPDATNRGWFSAEQMRALPLSGPAMRALALAAG